VPASDPLQADANRCPVACDGADVSSTISKEEAAEKCRQLALLGGTRYDDAIQAALVSVNAKKEKIEAMELESTQLQSAMVHASNNKALWASKLNATEVEAQQALGTLASTQASISADQAEMDVLALQAERANDDYASTAGSTTEERSALSQLMLDEDKAKADKKLAEMKKEAANSQLAASETAAALKKAQDLSDKKYKHKLEADKKVIDAEIDGDNDKLIESRNRQAKATEHAKQAKTAAETAEQQAIEAAHTKGEMDEALAHATEEHAKDIGNATASADKRDSGPFARKLLQASELQTVKEATAEQELAAAELENATAALDSVSGKLDTATEAVAKLEGSLGKEAAALKMTEEEAAAFKKRFDALVKSNAKAQKELDRLAKEMADARKGLAKAEETETAFKDQFEALQEELTDNKQTSDQLEMQAHNESPCAGGALRMHGQCWYLGEVGASCRQTCEAHGGTAYDATVGLANDPVMPHLLKQSEMQVPPKARPGVAPVEVSRGNEYFAAAPGATCQALPAALPSLTELSQGLVMDGLAVDIALMAHPTDALVMDFPTHFQDNIAIKGSSGLPIKFTINQANVSIYVAAENGTLPASFKIQTGTVDIRLPDGSEAQLSVFQLPSDLPGECELHIAGSQQPACNNLPQDQWIKDKDHGGPSGRISRADCAARASSWATTCSSVAQSRLAGQPVTSTSANMVHRVEIPLTRLDTMAITFFPSSTAPPPPPPALLPAPPPPPGWCQVKISGSDQTACANIPKVEWFYDKDFMGPARKMSQTECESRGWDSMCNTQAQYRVSGGCVAVMNDISAEWSMTAPAAEWTPLNDPKGAWYGVEDASDWIEGEEVSLSLVATSTSTSDTYWGYEGAKGGGWLEFTVPAGAKSQAILVDDPVSTAFTKFQIRSPLNDGTVTFKKVKMFRGPPECLDNNSPAGESRFDSCGTIEYAMPGAQLSCSCSGVLKWPMKQKLLAVTPGDSLGEQVRSVKLDGKEVSEHPDEAGLELVTLNQHTLAVESVSFFQEGEHVSMTQMDITSSSWQMASDACAAERPGADLCSQQQLCHGPATRQVLSMMRDWDEPTLLPVRVGSNSNNWMSYHNALERCSTQRPAWGTTSDSHPSKHTALCCLSTELQDLARAGPSTANKMLILTSWGNWMMQATAKLLSFAQRCGLQQLEDKLVVLKDAEDPSSVSKGVSYLFIGMCSDRAHIVEKLGKGQGILYNTLTFAGGKDGFATNSNVAGESEFSPKMVQTVDAIGVTSSSLNLEWEPCLDYSNGAPIVGYKVRMWLKDSLEVLPTWLTYTNNTGSQLCQVGVDHLMPNSTYKFRVHAITTAAIGAGLDTGFVTTLPPGLNNLGLQSLGATISSSVGIDALAQPANMIDGRASTSWNSGDAISDAWVRLDIGRANMQVSLFVIRWVGFNQPTGFRLSVSTDGSKFFLAKGLSELDCTTPSRHDQVPVKPKTVQWIHLELKQFCANPDSPAQYYDIAAFEVYSQVWEPIDALEEFDFSSGSGRFGQLTGSTEGPGSSLLGGQLVINPSTHFQSSPMQEDIKSKTLEAWVYNSNMRSHCQVLSLQTVDGRQHDSIFYNNRIWSVESSAPNDPQLGRGVAGAPEQQPDWVHIAAVFPFGAGNGSLGVQDQPVLYRNGFRYGQPPQLIRPNTYSSAQPSVLVFGHKESQNCSIRVDRAALFNRALSDAEIQALYAAGSEPHGVPDHKFEVMDTTWRNARSHCEKRCKRLCRQSEVCPGGISLLKKPRGSNSWTPVGDSHNSWLALRPPSKRNTCQLHQQFMMQNGSTVYTKPGWGDTEGAASVPILCCSDDISQSNAFDVHFGDVLQMFAVAYDGSEALWIHDGISEFEVRDENGNLGGLRAVVAGSVISLYSAAKAAYVTADHTTWAQDLTVLPTDSNFVGSGRFFFEALSGTRNLYYSHKVALSVIDPVNAKTRLASSGTFELASVRAAAVWRLQHTDRLKCQHTYIETQGQQLAATSSSQQFSTAAEAQAACNSDGMCRGVTATGGVYETRAGALSDSSSADVFTFLKKGCGSRIPTIVSSKPFESPQSLASGGSLVRAVNLDPQAVAVKLGCINMLGASDRGPISSSWVSASWNFLDASAVDLEPSATPLEHMTASAAWIPAGDSSHSIKLQDLAVGGEYKFQMVLWQRTGSATKVKVKLAGAVHTIELPSDQYEVVSLTFEATHATTSPEVAMSGTGDLMLGSYTLTYLSDNIALGKQVEWSGPTSASNSVSACANSVRESTKEGAALCKTEQYANPWIVIDLGAEYFVSSVKVLNVPDESALHDGSSWVMLATQPFPPDLTTSKAISITKEKYAATTDDLNYCLQAMYKVRYVKLQVESSGKSLQVDDIEVHGQSLLTGECRELIPFNSDNDYSTLISPEDNGCTTKIAASVGGLEDGFKVSLSTVELEANATYTLSMLYRSNCRIMSGSTAYEYTDTLVPSVVYTEGLTTFTTSNATPLMFHCAGAGDFLGINRLRLVQLTGEDTVVILQQPAHQGSKDYPYSCQKNPRSEP
jgi:hypothetical protein